MKSAPERDLWNFPTMVCMGCTIMPFIAVHGAFFISASYEYVNWCNPYWDSCTSISATGRRAPASYWFRGLMLPVSMLMVVYWWLHWTLLGRLGQAGTRRDAMFFFGVLACIGLAAYVTVLGEIGDLWRAQRRIGAILFFSLTYLSQLLLASGLRSTLNAPACSASFCCSSGSFSVSCNSTSVHRMTTSKTPSYGNLRCYYNSTSCLP